MITDGPNGGRRPLGPLGSRGVGGETQCRLGGGPGGLWCLAGSGCPLNQAGASPELLQGTRTRATRTSAVSGRLLSGRCGGVLEIG